MAGPRLVLLAQLLGKLSVRAATRDISSTTRPKHVIPFPALHQPSSRSQLARQPLTFNQRLISLVTRTHLVRIGAPCIRVVFTHLVIWVFSRLMQPKNIHVNYTTLVPPRRMIATVKATYAHMTKARLPIHVPAANILMATLCHQISVALDAQNVQQTATQTGQTWFFQTASVEAVGQRSQATRQALASQCLAQPTAKELERVLLVHVTRASS